MSDQLSSKNTLKLLLAVSVIAFAEAAILFLLGAFTVYQEIIGQAEPISSWFLAVFLFSVTLFVAKFAGALAQGMRWARTAAIFWQIMQLSIAFGSVQGPNPNYFIGIFLGAISLFVIVVLFMPNVMSATSKTKGQ